MKRNLLKKILIFIGTILIIGTFFVARHYVIKAKILANLNEIADVIPNDFVAPISNKIYEENNEEALFLDELCFSISKCENNKCYLDLADDYDSYKNIQLPLVNNLNFSEDQKELLIDKNYPHEHTNDFHTDVFLYLNHYYDFNLHKQVTNITLESNNYYITKNINFEYIDTTREDYEYSKVIAENVINYIPNLSLNDYFENKVYEQDYDKYWENIYKQFETNGFEIKLIPFNGDPAIIYEAGINIIKDGIIYNSVTVKNLCITDIITIPEDSTNDSLAVKNEINKLIDESKYSYQILDDTFKIGYNSSMILFENITHDETYYSCVWNETTEDFDCDVETNTYPLHVLIHVLKIDESKKDIIDTITDLERNASKLQKNIVLNYITNYYDSQNLFENGMKNKDSIIYLLADEEANIVNNKYIKKEIVPIVSVEYATYECGLYAEDINQCVLDYATNACDDAINESDDEFRFCMSEYLGYEYEGEIENTYFSNYPIYIDDFNTNKEVNIGETFNIDVVINDKNGLSSYSYNLSYDNTKLNLISGESVVSETDVRGKTEVRYRYTFESIKTGMASINLIEPYVNGSYYGYYGTKREVQIYSKDIDISDNRLKRLSGSDYAIIYTISDEDNNVYYKEAEYANVYIKVDYTEETSNIIEELKEDLNQFRKMSFDESLINDNICEFSDEDVSCYLENAVKSSREYYKEDYPNMLIGAHPDNGMGGRCGCPTWDFALDYAKKYNNNYYSLGDYYATGNNILLVPKDVNRLDYAKEKISDILDLAINDVNIYKKECEEQCDICGNYQLETPTSKNPLTFKIREQFESMDIVNTDFTIDLKDTNKYQIEIDMKPSEWMDDVEYLYDNYETGGIVDIDENGLVTAYGTGTTTVIINGPERKEITLNIINSSETYLNDLLNELPDELDVPHVKDETIYWTFEKLTTNNTVANTKLFDNKYICHKYNSESEFVEVSCFVDDYENSTEDKIKVNVYFEDIFGNKYSSSKEINLNYQTGNDTDKQIIEEALQKINTYYETGGEGFNDNHPHMIDLNLKETYDYYKKSCDGYACGENKLLKNKLDPIFKEITGLDNLETYAYASNIGDGYGSEFSFGFPIYFGINGVYYKYLDRDCAYHSNNFITVSGGSESEMTIEAIEKIASELDVSEIDISLTSDWENTEVAREVYSEEYPDLLKTFVGVYELNINNTKMYVSLFRENIEVTSIKIKTPDTAYVTDWQELQYEVTPSDANVSNIQITSSDEDVISIYDSSMEFRKAGTSTITVSSGSVSDSIVIEVVNPEVNIVSLTQGKNILEYKDDKYILNSLESVKINTNIDNLDLNLYSYILNSNGEEIAPSYSHSFSFIDTFDSHKLEGENSSVTYKVCSDPDCENLLYNQTLDLSFPAYADVMDMDIQLDKVVQNNIELTKNNNGDYVINTKSVINFIFTGNNLSENYNYNIKLSDNMGSVYNYQFSKSDFDNNNVFIRLQPLSEDVTEIFFDFYVEDFLISTNPIHFELDTSTQVKEYALSSNGEKAYSSQPIGDYIYFDNKVEITKCRRRSILNAYEPTKYYVCEKNDDSHIQIYSKEECGTGANLEYINTVDTIYSCVDSDDDSVPENQVENENVTCYVYSNWEITDDVAACDTSKPDLSNIVTVEMYNWYKLIDVTSDGKFTSSFKYQNGENVTSVNSERYWENINKELYVDKDYANSDKPLTLNIKGKNYIDKDYAVDVLVYENKNEGVKYIPLYSSKNTVNGNTLNDGYNINIDASKFKYNKEIRNSVSYIVYIFVDNSYEKIEIIYNSTGKMTDVFGNLYHNNDVKDKSEKAGDLYINFEMKIYEASKNLFEVNDNYLNYYGKDFDSNTNYSYELRYSDGQDFDNYKDYEVITSGNIKGSLFNNYGKTFKIDNYKNYIVPRYTFVVYNGDELVHTFVSNINSYIEGYIQSIVLSSPTGKYSYDDDRSIKATKDITLKYIIYGQGFDDNKNYIIQLESNINDWESSNIKSIKVSGKELNEGYEYIDNTDISKANTYEFIAWSTNYEESWNECYITFVNSSEIDNTPHIDEKLSNFKRNINVISEHGTVDVNNWSFINDEVSFDALADNDYIITNIKYLKSSDNSDVTNIISTGENKFNMPSYDVTIEVEYKNLVHNISANNNSYDVTDNAINYNINNGYYSLVSDKASEGQDVLISLYPNTYYILDELKVYKTGDESKTIEVKNNTFVMPEYDVTIYVSYKLDSHLITGNGSLNNNIYNVSNGSYSLSNSESIMNEIITLTFNPHQYYVLDSCKIYKKSDNSDITSLVEYSNGKFVMPNYDVKVDVKFKVENDLNKNNIPDETEKHYTVSFNTNGNGSLNGNLKYENILTGLSIKNANIVIPSPVASSNSIFNGWSNNLNESTIINSDIVFTATFKQTIFSINKEITNGIINVKDTANAGEKINISFMPNTNYVLDTVKILKLNGTDVTNEVNYSNGTFTMPEYDIKLVVIFKLNTFNIKINGYNVKINVVSTAKVNDEVNISYITNPGYKFVSLKITKIDGSDVTKLVNFANNSFIMPEYDVIINIETISLDLSTTVLKISKGNNSSLILEWNKQNKEETYYIYRSTSKTKGYKKIAETTSNTYTNTGLTYGKTYYYKIYAQNSIKKTEYSNIVSKKVVPNKVTNLKFVSSGSEKIKLSWDKVSTTGYEIYKSTSKSGKYSKVTTVTKNSTLSYTNKKLTGNKTYYYKVRAYKTVSGKKVYGSYSDIVEMKTAPKKTKVSVSLKDYKTLNVKITSVSGASKYEIVRSTSKKGTYSKVGEITSGTYVDTNLTAGKTYYYKVRACNSNGSCGSYSDIKSKKVVPNKPGISASSQETKKVNITINNVVGANGYEVYRSTKKSSGYKKVATVTELSYINSTKKGKIYYYKVRTYTLVNGKKVYSDYSSVKKVKSK